ncbi:unnamed protein product, partial [Durusdinium trenchii]
VPWDTPASWTASTLRSPHNIRTHSGVLETSSTGIVWSSTWSNDHARPSRHCRRIWPRRSANSMRPTRWTPCAG